MIHDVDEALKALIRREALNGSDVEVLFDAPTKEWAGRRNAPTVDCYLYDIREDVSRRAVGRIEVLDEQGFVTGHKPPPRYFRLSYLLTAWTQRAEDEHRLLSALLMSFLLRDTVPDDLLAGTLTDLPDAVRTKIAQPPPEDRSIADVWSALGGELKPSLDLVVTVPVDTRRFDTAAPPVLEEPRLTLGGDGVGEEQPVRNHRFGPGGTAVTTRAAPAPAAAELEETRHGGADSRPGRILRVRGRPVR